MIVYLGQLFLKTNFRKRGKQNFYPNYYGQERNTFSSHNTFEIFSFLRKSAIEYQRTNLGGMRVLPNDSKQIWSFFNNIRFKKRETVGR